jgi:hypothetical protein
MSLSKDHMKLASEVRKTVLRRWESYQNASPCKLHPPRGVVYEIVLPRDRRSQRALGIACWFLPDWLKWEIILQLGSRPYSLDYSSKGLEISLEIRLLVETKNIMVSYLSYFINPRELFGTILQEDLLRALKLIRVKRTQEGPVIRPIRRKGYKDKGTWRLPHCWKERFDLSFIEAQNLKETKLSLFRVFTILLLRKLGEEGKSSRR